MTQIIILSEGSEAWSGGGLTPEVRLKGGNAPMTHVQCPKHYFFDILCLLIYFCAFYLSPVFFSSFVTCQVPLAVGTFLSSLSPTSFHHPSFIYCPPAPLSVPFTYFTSSPV